MLKKQNPVGCVVMAAGNSSRFHKNKLLASLDGKALIQRALEAVPADALRDVCVVTRYGEVRDAAARFGFRCLWNDRPELGVSYTIRLGVEALADACEGIVFLAADQPLLRRESVSALAVAFQEHPDSIVCLSSGGVRGNPCVFPRALYPELTALTGDTGGSSVIRRFPERVLLLDASPRELLDADTPEALEQMKNL